MSTLAGMLCSTTHQHRDRTAVLDGERAFTWEEFGDRVARAAQVLTALGVQPGERFAVLSRNGRRAAELLYAGYWCGAVPVPLNFRLASPELRDLLEDSGCRLVFAEDALGDLLGGPALAPWREQAVLMGPASEGGGGPQYEAMLAAARPRPPHQGSPEDEAILLYTGGTTGRGKGVRLSHRNVLAAALQTAPALGTRADDVYLHVAPMFHSADLLPTSWFLYGACHVYLPAFSPPALLQAIERHRVSFLMLPPTVLILALQDPGFEGYDLSSLRGILYGASPMPEEWIRRTLERLPRVELFQGYGLTETAPILTILSGQAHREAAAGRGPERLRSCGRPVVGVELRIDDPDGSGVGEVVARGRNVMLGYWNREAENREALRDGWLRTGDVGRVDGEGYLYLVDRRKDMVITGGENVYPAEVEAVLRGHPGVREAAVVGVPDATFGEALLAVIVPEPGAGLDPSQVIEHCRGRIGGYKIPRRIELVDQLPKSALGKVLKAELRRVYGGGG